ncbi:MAG: 5'-methylthioadenosine/adenosylhomocysteine nucleosidase [Clostridia bacterium]|nr:5'-methylthioadenosine/adenosylhomocysteine nucleosidase [Clostridia bacterium]
MIGIIGAMDSETQGLKNLICDKKTKIISGIEFVWGKLNGKDVVCAKCNPGKVNSALCAQAMILEFSPEVIINSGVAGSLTKELGIYDVAIAKDCVQHDFDTSPLGSPVGMIDGLDKIYFECDSHAVETLKKVCENEKYMLGTIASGDVFVSGDEAKSRITKNFNAIACEMEGASIAHVCYVNDVKFGILRVISDGGDEVDFGTFVKETSKKSIEIMSRFIELY